jgi:hypothetical protein
VRVSRHGLNERDRSMVDHYEQSLSMLTELIPGHRLVDQLRLELQALWALPAGGT